jgi:hypothetical protein
MRSIKVHSHSTAPASAVYRIILDGSTWATWAPLDSVEIQKPADGDAPAGVSPDRYLGAGAIRVVRIGRIASREQITALIPERRFDYIILPGGVFRDYRATIELVPAAQGGTDIRWSATFRGRIPGTGWLYGLPTRRLLDRMARGLARHAAATCEEAGQ